MTELRRKIFFAQRQQPLKPQAPGRPLAEANEGARAWRAPKEGDAQLTRQVMRNAGDWRGETRSRQAVIRNRSTGRSSSKPRQVILRSSDGAGEWREPRSRQARARNRSAGRSSSKPRSTSKPRWIKKETSCENSKEPEAECADREAPSDKQSPKEENHPVDPTLKDKVNPSIQEEDPEERPRRDENSDNLKVVDTSTGPQQFDIAAADTDDEEAEFFP
ncbi:unnamed protein product [Effrenium voratum]|uniref:Uncharacterized protein n=1 Tax=Effrenium voratum TaxID=2562239 RepID=A0AA36I785_9DINO|nr:unnamed protein product [Effrenium voratum]